MMVVYHAAYDVWFLAPSLEFSPFQGGWRALQVATGSTFLGVVGISLAVANARARSRGFSGYQLWRRHTRRALQVLAAAFVVTIVTRIALGSGDYIRFGVLHLIAAMMLLLPWLVPLGWRVLLPFGASVIAVGLLIREITSTIPGAMIVGFPHPHGSGVDYYPLLPWGGCAIIGLGIGLALYPGGSPRPWLARAADSAGQTLGVKGRILATWPGRHALPIYLVHQIALIALVAGVLWTMGIAVAPR